MNKTKRRWLPNLQSVRIDDRGVHRTARVCTALPALESGDSPRLAAQSDPTPSARAPLRSRRIPAPSRSAPTRSSSRPEARRVARRQCAKARGRDGGEQFEIFPARERETLRVLALAFRARARAAGATGTRSIDPRRSRSPAASRATSVERPSEQSIIARDVTARRQKATLGDRAAAGGETRAAPRAAASPNAVRRPREFEAGARRAERPGNREHVARPPPLRVFASERRTSPTTAIAIVSASRARDRSPPAIASLQRCAHAARPR